MSKVKFDESDKEYDENVDKYSHVKSKNKQREEKVKKERKDKNYGG